MPAIDAGLSHRFIWTFRHPALFRRNGKPASRNNQAPRFAGWQWLAAVRLQCGHAQQRFCGTFFNKMTQGTNFNTAEYFRLAHLSLPAQGNQPGRLHQSSLSRMLAWMGGSCACPLTETLTGATRARINVLTNCDRGIITVKSLSISNT
jgi:hypothetical protein